MHSLVFLDILYTYGNTTKSKIDMVTKEMKLLNKSIKMFCKIIEPIHTHVVCFLKIIHIVLKSIIYTNRGGEVK